MTTDIERYTTPTPNGVAVQHASANNALMAWADSARAAADIAHSLGPTPFIPASLIARTEDNRGIDIDRTVGNVLGAILTGTEIGLQPMAALRSIDIVNGTPAMRALALRGVLQAAGHDIWVVEANESRAIVRGRRKGSTEVQESLWTMDRARKLNLAGKQNWRNQPQAMLTARATAECARLVAADALLGLAYASEELADDLAGVVEPDAQPSGEVQPAKRTARRRTAQPTAVARPPVEAAETGADPEPDFDEATPAATDDGFANAEPINAAQLAKLHIQFKELGVEDRDAGLALIGGIVGRDVDSSKRLSKQEATALIDELDRRLLAWQAETPSAADAKEAEESR